MQQIVDMTGFQDIRDASQSAKDANTLTNFDENNLAAGERQLGDEWRVWSCPCVYLLAVR